MSKLSDHLDRLSDELIDRAVRAAHAGGFQGASTTQPFQEGIAVLRRIRDEMRDAENQSVTDAMPYGLLRAIEGGLESVITTLNEIVAGHNNVQTFANVVDSLHVHWWSGGFRLRGKRLLGFEAKYAELVALGARFEDARINAHAIELMVGEIRASVDHAELALVDIKDSVNSAKSDVSQINQILSEAVSLNGMASQQSTVFASHVALAAESAATAQARAQEATTSQKALEAYYQKVDAYEQKLSDTVSGAQTSLTDLQSQAELTLKKQNDGTDALIKRLEEVEKDINSKLVRATGHTLFHAFETRQRGIQKGLNKWLWLGIALLLGASVYAWYMLRGVGDITVAFWVKLGLTFPVGLAVAFAFTQYSRERRLEEEYAFKSALSLSLEPYRKLIEDALEKLTPEERVAYAEFLTKSIGTIFDPPTDRVFGERRVRGVTDTKVISEFASTVQKMKDAFTPK